MATIIKFRRLKNSLQSRALSIIQSIRLTSDNFLPAWNTLCDKYNNKPLRFSLQMKVLEQLPSATKETSTHLSSLLSDLDEAIVNLKDIGRPTDSWDDIFNYFLVSKLSDSTRLDWIKHAEVSKFGDFPKYAQLKDFLQKRIRSLDLSNSKQIEDKDNSSSKSNDKSQHQKSTQHKKPGVQGSAAHVSSTKSDKKGRKYTCSFCKNSHFLAYCDKFLNASTVERKAVHKLFESTFN